MRNAFHQAAVAEKNISAVIDNGMAGAIEFRSEQFFRQRHADCIGDALTERRGMTSA